MAGTTHFNQHFTSAISLDLMIVVTKLVEKHRSSLAELAAGT
jgi:hypothetical protein